MIFNSAIFFVFFIAFFPVYWLINNRLKPVYRNAFIVLASYLFYGWWDWRFLGLIFISSLVDFLVGLQLGKTQSTSRKNTLLGISIAVNLGFLGFFKYFNFFIDSLNELSSVLPISLNLTTLNIILPVGISFYTFQTLSYTIDIYKGKLEPTKDVIAFFSFVSFFPQLVAGPIERASHLLKQFNEAKVFNYELIVSGLRLVLWGMFKKVVIADNFGHLADVVFDPKNPATGAMTLLGAFFFAFQIYADFSGYSSIAIGVSKMLGFDLMKNFKTPYFSTSLKEFWQRWHISLSTWFKDYVYIPLGGNRGTSQRIAFNLFLTFLISGLWHGANVTFLIWGGLHGAFLILERWLNPQSQRTIPSILIFVLVMLLWIPFRAQDMEHLSILTTSIFQFNTYSFKGIHELLLNYSMIKAGLLSFVFAGFLILESQFKGRDFSEWMLTQNKSLRWTVYYGLLLVILLMGNFAIKPQFIYFQF